MRRRLRSSQCHCDERSALDPEVYCWLQQLADILSLRAHAIICACLFAALIGFAILGNVLQTAGMKPLEGRASIVALSARVS
jgi:hypothetical protein